VLFIAIVLIVPHYMRELHPAGRGLLRDGIDIGLAMVPEAQWWSEPYLQGK
jgi:hypothetical protein